MSQGQRPKRGELGAARVFVIAVCLALLSRLGLLSFLPVYDELYHILAAQGLNQSGQPAILDGTYSRVLVFTASNALVMDLFGADSIWHSRFVLSVIPSAAMTGIIVLWTYKELGCRASALVMLFMLFWPIGIEVAQFNRFYALHGMLLWTFLLSAYFATQNHRPTLHRFLYTAISVLSGICAYHMQDTTLIAFAAFAGWAILYFCAPVAIARPKKFLKPVVLIGIVGGVLLLTGLLYSFRETVYYYINLLTWDPTGKSIDPTYYSRRIRDSYPIFWGITIFLFILSLKRDARAAFFFAMIFFVQISVLSISSHKGDRFLFALMPSIFILWSAGIIGFLNLFSGKRRGFWDEAIGQYTWIPRRLTIIALTGTAFLFLCATTPAITRAGAMMLGLRGQDSLLRSPRFNWETAPEIGKDILLADGIVVTRKELHALHVLGDFDFGFNKSRLAELGTGSIPFTIDPRTGRPMIDNLTSLEKVISCYPTGMFLVSARWWWSTPATRQIESIAHEHAAVIDVRFDRDFVMLTWQQGRSLGSPDMCETLYKLRPL